LLVAIGAALIWARSLTSRLTRLWYATQKVSEGDFTVRVPDVNESVAFSVDQAESGEEALEQI